MQAWPYYAYYPRAAHQCAGVFPYSRRSDNPLSGTWGHFGMSEHQDGGKERKKKDEAAEEERTGEEDDEK